MAVVSLEERASRLPTEPGVYLFRDRRGAVLYVGKASNLRARVRQYLGGHDGRAMVPWLLAAAEDVEAVVTTTAKEALLLENDLIKKHQPKFNVKLRDDATYLHLAIDRHERFPRVRVTRKARPGWQTFGPYPSASQAREALSVLQRLFPLRTCSDAVMRSRRRACVLAGMGRCVAPCVEPVDGLTYAALVDGAAAFLSGKVGPVLVDLESRMATAAAEERFEEAAVWRDRAAAVRATVARQQIVDVRGGARDVWAIARAGFDVAVVRLPVREGRVGEPVRRVRRAVMEDDAEVLSSEINASVVTAAAEVLVPFPLPDADALAEALSERRGRKVVLRVPDRGPKAELVALARRNAEAALQGSLDAEARTTGALSRVAEVLGLARPPARIECFDNSHLAGTEPVAAMAVMLDGRVAPSQKRTYRIQRARGGDDYGGMREVLYRRLRRGLEEGGLPDLLVVDGGAGQVRVAVEVRDALGANVPICGIVKPRAAHRRGDRDATDRLVTEAGEPLVLAAHDPGLRLLQRLRDETHRSAVGFQRKRRSKETFRSTLEDVPGLGPVRRRRLVAALGSVEAVVEADVATLASVPGISSALAVQIRSTLDGWLAGEHVAPGAPDAAIGPWLLDDLDA
jgi:excinuclease ABC subunit C